MAAATVAVVTYAPDAVLEAGPTADYVAYQLSSSKARSQPMGQQEIAIIVGTGPGLSASLTRLCAREGMQVVVAARDTGKLADLVRDAGAHPIACDVVDRRQVESLFEEVDKRWGSPHLVVFNAGERYRAPIEAIDPERFDTALRVTALGGL